MLQQRGSPPATSPPLAVRPAGAGMAGGNRTHATPTVQPPTVSLGMLSQLHGSVPETGQELEGIRDENSGLT